MKSARPIKDEASAPGMGAVTVSPARFTGTDNPRHLRVIHALMRRPMPREQLDQIAGASNSPDLVAELRRRGLEIPCERAKKVDRDLFDCWPGAYHLTERDRQRIGVWLRNRPVRFPS